MLFRLLAGLFDEPKGIWVIARTDRTGTTHFLVRPGVVVVDGDKVASATSPSTT